MDFTTFFTKTSPYFVPVDAAHRDNNDFLLLIATNDHMIERTREFNTRRSRHDGDSAIPLMH